MRLEGKTAIITGAGGGIGFEYARRFLREGARVVVAEIDEDEGKGAVESLAALGEIDFVRTDVADEASTDACAAFALDRFGSIDILLDNAAIYGDYVGTDNSLAYLRRVFDVNLHGQWLMAKAVAPTMVEKRWGRIINVASIAGYHWQVPALIPEFETLGSWSYSQTKWGVIGLTRLLAGQLGQFNVTVNCIAPGLVHTPATERQVPREFQPVFANMTSMKRNCEPEHMVGTAVYFASDDADLVNGLVIVIDGGGVMPG